MRAPNGKSVRPTKVMLSGRTNPASPTRPHATSNGRHSVSGELKPKLTRHRPPSAGNSRWLKQTTPHGQLRPWANYYNIMHIEMSLDVSITWPPKIAPPGLQS